MNARKLYNFHVKRSAIITGKKLLFEINNCTYINICTIYVKTKVDRIYSLYHMRIILIERFVFSHFDDDGM